MTIRHDPDEIVTAWLEEGPTRLPDQARRAISVALPTTTQRRRGWPAPWRPTDMIPFARTSAAIVALTLLVVGTVYVIGPGRDGSTGGVSTATPTASPTVAPTATPRASTPTAAPTTSPDAVRESSDRPPLDTTGWTPYTSARYGYQGAYPSGWTFVPADHDWTWATDGTDWLSTGADTFIKGDGSIRISIWAAPIKAKQKMDSWTDIEAWAVDYCERAHDTSCDGIHGRVVPLCVENRDCHPALLVPFDEDVIGFATGGILPEGMLVASVWWGEDAPAVAQYGGSRRLLEALLSTMGISRPVYPETQDAAARFLASGA
jgi:hypothetical protein